MDNQKIGSFILELRKSKNMTQKELAEKLNVTDKAVSKWERGLGYPEITMTPLLAEQLGVTVNELLLGERIPAKEEPAALTENTEAIISDVVQYVAKTKKQKTVRAGEIALAILSSAFLIAVFVCLLCNYAINKTFSWSLYVAGGVVTAWLAIAPFFLMKNHRLLTSAASLTITVVPFLLLIEYLCPVKNWVVPIALPIVLLALVSFWASVLLFTYTKKVVQKNRIGLLIVTFTLLLAVFVCMLCNYATGKTFDWSLYVVGGTITAWLTIAPLLLMKKKRWLVSMADLTVTTVPLLLLINYLCPDKNLVFPFVLPIVAFALASLWITVLLFAYTKISRLYLTALLFVLYGVIMEIGINTFVYRYLNLPEDNVSVAITSISCGFVAVVLAIIGFIKQRESRTDSVQEYNS